MLVAPILDPKQRTRSSLHARKRFPSDDRQIKRRRNRGQVRTGHNLLHRRQRPRTQRNGPARIERRRTPHDHAPQPGLFDRRPTNDLPQFRLGFARDRATVEHRDVRLSHSANDAMPRVDDHGTHGFGIVLVRSASKGS
jgi:hypothetical protein